MNASHLQTSKEFKKLYLSQIGKSTYRPDQSKDFYVPSSNPRVVDVDWRTKHAVTSVKNQVQFEQTALCLHNTTSCRVNVAAVGHLLLLVL